MESQHIDLLELQAMFWVLQHFKPMLQERHVSEDQQPHNTGLHQQVGWGLVHCSFEDGGEPVTMGHRTYVVPEVARAPLSEGIITQDSSAACCLMVISVEYVGPISCTEQPVLQGWCGWEKS